MTGIHVRFVAQLKQAAGRSEDHVSLDAAATLIDLLGTLASRHGEVLRDFLLTADGTLRPSLLVAVGDQQVARGTNPALRPGDTVTLISPMSGG